MAAPVLESVLSKLSAKFVDLSGKIMRIGDKDYIEMSSGKHSFVPGNYQYYIDINIVISVMDKYIDISICTTRVSVSLRHETSLYTSRAIYRQSVELYVGEVQ